MDTISATGSFDPSISFQYLYLLTGHASYFPLVLHLYVPQSIDPPKPVSMSI